MEQAKRYHNARAARPEQALFRAYGDEMAMMTSARNAYGHSSRIILFYAGSGNFSEVYGEPWNDEYFLKILRILRA